MLITKEVEVAINGNNAKYYESLGYEIPRVKNIKGNFVVKRGTTIVIDANDLTSENRTLIDVKCDCCKSDKQIANNSYKRNINKNCGKYYCHSCTMKLFNSGENNNLWNPNKTDEEREQERNTPEYVEFIRRIITRDNYTCQCCGKQGIKIEVHHMDGYNWCVEKRMEETNCLSLCVNCHTNFHSTYGYGDNTKEQFEEWFGKTIELVQSGIEILPTKKVYCIEENKVYDSAKQVADKLHVLKDNIYLICNKKKSCKSAKGLHFLWFDDYEKMTQRDIEEYLESCKDNKNQKNICITTGEIFESLEDASKKYNITASCISSCCRGESKSASHLPDGTRLKWMFYDDYLDRTNNGEEIFVPEERIICITTGEIFVSLDYACKAYPQIDNGNIAACCKGIKRSMGKLPDGTPLMWMYYKDYLQRIENGEEILCHPVTKRSKKIICTTTMELFDSLKYASESSGIKQNYIGDCCKGRQKSAGKLSDGTPLVWMFYEDYLKDNPEIISNKEKKIINEVICTTTYKVFDSSVNASKYYNIDNDSIIDCCENKIKTIGQLEDGTPLQWLYYKDYLRKQNEEY